MSDNFKAVIKTAVTFNINILLVIISYIKNFFCIVIATIVYFKLNTKISFSLSLKLKVRFVDVIVNIPVACFSIVAVLTIRILLTFIKVIGILISYNSTTAITKNSYIIKTLLTIKFTIKFVNLI